MKAPQQEDQLDDLDDLMCGGDSGLVKAGNDLDDDLFGGGNDNDDEYFQKKKKKGTQDDDPLAFLKRAQQEKEDIALKKQNDEKNAKAAWKELKKLNYNLMNKHMDQDDKWRLILGQDLYKEKSNNLNVDTQAR